jgi:hypothetical protein
MMVLAMASLLADTEPTVVLEQRDEFLDGTVLESYPV